jgi:hypothetical protein
MKSETRQCRVSTGGGTQLMMALTSAGGGLEASQTAKAWSEFPIALRVARGSAAQEPLVVRNRGCHWRRTPGAKAPLSYFEVDC